MIKLPRVVLPALASAFVFVLAVTPASAQQPATPAQPLTVMPYSPSFNLTSLDRSVNPCVNFYKYACGGWQKLNPIPPDQATWDVYAKLSNENEQFLWGILEQDAKATDRTPVQQKIGDYFEACMNKSAINAEGDKPIAAALATINGLETRPELLAAIAKLHHDDPGSFFFRSGTTQDAVDSSKMIVELGAGGMGLPDRDYYLKTDPQSVKIREQYTDYIAQLLTLSGESAAQAHTDADSILHIETVLAKASLTRVQERNPHNLYHMMSIGDVQSMAPAIKWAAYFKAEGAPDVSNLNVSQPAFIKALQTELSTEKVAALRAYLRFHLLSAMAPYLAKPYDDAFYGFYSTTLRGVPQQPPRWKTCTRAVDRNLGEALGQEFVRRTFSAQTKAKTELMTQQIEAAMQHEIENLDWMSPATKEEALRKLHAIRNKIGYPDHWRSYTALEVKPNDYAGDVVRAYQFNQAYEWNKLGKPVNHDEWGMTPPTVNAYFDPQMNDINFPAGVLQPPLYDPKMDDAPNYGNTGATIGHELTHAFDDEGRLFDSKGNLRDWWTPADAQGFEQRIGCVRKQYAGYVIVDDIHINSKLTSGEDVADLGGTLLAYIAWKKETAGENLPDINGFTPDQRFFIGMAQWACSNERPQNERVQAATDPHSPPFARINGVVSNLPQFQKAFSCKAGQPMVHTPTCKVW
ncbi:MAG: M13 family metallopeptidase [Acidobacteriaceae bacterium]